VLRLSISTAAGGCNLRLHSSQVNLAIMAFLCVTLLLAAGTSLGQVRIRTSLVRLITWAFFVSMLFPLSGLAWLGAASARNNREDESQKIIQLVRQNLRQTETAFMLQRFRQQLLMLHLSRVIATIGAARWDEYVKHFFPPTAESLFRAHFLNYYLYSAQFDREFFRGQHSADRFRKNDLPTVMSGAFRRFLMNAGSYDHLSEGGRQKIAQLADFSSGVLEELVDNNFFSRIFSSPGELHSATQLARSDLLTVFFVRGPQKIYGMICFATNNYLPAVIIDELNARGSFKNRFTLQNHRIDIDFFNINPLFERRLDGRDSPFAIENPPAISLEAANTLYVDSDSTSIDNLHLARPHLLVTETMVDRSIFAVARIQPPSRPASENSGAAMLTLIALTSCLALAAGISRLILMPVTPFLAALKEIENNHYDWNLNLQTGDEFDLLASSINNMRVSLLERRKMLQLVSQGAAEAVRSGEDTDNKPRRRSATILFSDIRGFTTISEGHSAEDVVKMLNSYFTLMCPAIEENGGFIDKLIGDAIQAVFIDDDPYERVMSASRAALEIRRRLAAFNSERAARGLFAVNNGIGIASGIITTGLTGSSTGKLEAAVMGEPLQLASILESKSKFAINTCIILDEESQNAIKGHARFETLTIEASDNTPAFSITELQEIFQKPHLA
ncbi:MAG: adenylate/guanylate cyclase domain-containing protein, partial [Candidatus Riflebacteria bacterium]|nr:adenylate/guanylate cyclase domain-containing protein [Candidatus Riflebacteria bacterium]